MTKPTVLYNGSCPVCRTEIERYRDLAGEAGGFAWCNIADPATDPAAIGIDLEAIRRRLHLVDSDGRLLVGVPAFARIWEHLPGYRWRARLVRLPVVRPLARLLYEPLAATLYARDRRRRRKAEAATHRGGQGCIGS
jgi:predicted DCC family thiol-disulfide oxidoreductase YuxK